MPKGCVVSRADVKVPEAYARYVAAGTKAIAAHGGRVLARGGVMKRSKDRRGRETSCSNLTATRGRGPNFTPPTIRLRGCCARARPTWKWCWSRAFDGFEGV